MPVGRLGKGGVLRTWDGAYDVYPPGITTFTAGMRTVQPPVAAGSCPFSVGPLVQGRILGDGSGEGDQAQFANATGSFSSSMLDSGDSHAMTLLFWVTVQFDGDSPNKYMILGSNYNYNTKIWKGSDGYLYMAGHGSGWTVPICICDISSWQTGSTHLIIARRGQALYASALDTEQIHDFYIDNVRYTGTVAWTLAYGYGASPALGHHGSSPRETGAVVIRGFTSLRYPIWDGARGVRPANGLNEVAAIWNAGAGADPATIVAPYALGIIIPTNQTAAALTTGATHAARLSDAQGKFRIYGVRSQSSGHNFHLGPSVLYFDNANTRVVCGHDATLANLPTTPGGFTVLMRLRSLGKGEGNAGALLWKGNLAKTIGWGIRYENALNGYEFHICTDGVFARSRLWCGYSNAWGVVGFYYNNATTRKIWPFIAEWVANKYDNFFDFEVPPVAATGLYLDDSAQDLVIGDLGNQTACHYGNIGDLTIWSGNHFGVVEDPDIVQFLEMPMDWPTIDATVIEHWHMNEGTGATCVASVTSPANNGVITSGAWCNSPISTALAYTPTPEFGFGGYTVWPLLEITVPDSATIQDLASGAMSVEYCARHFTRVASTFYVERLIGKGDHTCGWEVSVEIGPGSRGLIMTIWTATGKAESWTGADVLCKAASRYESYTVQWLWDPATMTHPVLRLNGFLAAVQYTDQVGAPLSDAGLPLYHADHTFAYYTFIHVSNILRASASQKFGPAINTAVPVPDANSVLLWTYDSLLPYAGCDGMTVTDLSGKGNDGVYYVEAPDGGPWPDQNDGYVITPYYNESCNLSVKCTAPNDGLNTVEASLIAASTNYLLVANAQIGRDLIARPYIQIWDETINAQIGANIYAPRTHGTHDGPNDSANLIDADARWDRRLPGCMVINLTDDSSATIASNTATQVVGALAGGARNHWDIGDEYMIIPMVDGDVIRAASWAWFSITTFRTPVGTTRIGLRALDEDGVGGRISTMAYMWVNLCPYPNMEAGAVADPWIPTSWVNDGMLAGETAQDAVNFWTHGHGIHMSVAAVGHRLYFAPTVALTVGSYYMVGCMAKKVSGNPAIIERNGNRAYDYKTASTSLVIPITDTVDWNYHWGIFRAAHTTPQFAICSTGGAAEAYFDDFFLVALTGSTVTITPATLANSRETDLSLRVDGGDAASTPAVTAARLGATAGELRLGARPRDRASTVGYFGQTYEYLFWLQQDANNYIWLRLEANMMTLTYRASGGAIITGDWNIAAGEWEPDTMHSIDIKYNATIGMRMRVDGQIRITLAAPTFASAFNVAMKIGTDNSNANQFNGSIGPGT